MPNTTHKITLTSEEARHVFLSLIHVHVEFEHNGDNCLCIDIKKKLIDIVVLSEGDGE